eukprot:10808254-Alexandrium_andersonii.AAC.1
MRQREEAIPQWTVRDDSMSATEYWKRSSGQMTACHGRLVYRPKSRNPLGVVGASARCETALLPS